MVELVWIKDETNDKINIMKGPLRKKKVSDKTKIIVEININYEEDVFIERSNRGIIKRIVKEKPSGSEGEFKKFENINEELYRLIDPSSFSEHIEKKNSKKIFE